MRALEFLTGHVIFKLHYNQIYQLKTTIITDFRQEGPDLNSQDLLALA